jgi:undecaprenyl diphosphate synthase
LAALNLEELPGHTAIIMDGNGRWAVKRGLARSFGHRAGMENVKTTIRFASDIGLKELTLFALSTENYRKRPGEEVSLLMSLLLEFLKRDIREMHENNVKLDTFGDIGQLPREVEKAITDAAELTKNNTGLKVHIAVNYGSRAEIVNTMRKVAYDVKQGKLEIDDIDEKLVSAYLESKDAADPDLVVRTSGEQRISNFLLYQSAYAEYVFTETLWPDFDEFEFIRTLKEFQSRKRRFGGI